jgi:serine/threonine-protein kinase RsbT
MSDIVIAEATRVAIDSDRAIVEARQQGRQLALKLGFSSGSATLLATAISELARNILQYAGQGEIVMQLLDRGRDQGLMVLARDRGPGIADLSMAMEDGYSTSGRLGLGLPGVRRLMDEFQIESGVGTGTHVRVVKWNCM